MEEPAIYLLKSTLCISVFLGIYWCFLKNETFYRFNRYFLLSGLVCSLLLPFYTYTYNVNILSSTSFTPSSGALIKGTDNTFPWFYIAISIYLFGICFFLIRHIIGLYRIKRMIGKYGSTPLNGYKLVNTPVFKSSFSVFNYIIIDSSSEASDVEKRLILEHELAHAAQLHWIDLLIAQFFCAVQWFNPFAWMYLYIIKQNHEFLADRKVLEKGNSAAVYRATLINHTLGTPVFALASSFSHYNRLKRIEMMVRPASASIKKAAVITIFPALAILLWAFAEPRITIIQAKKTLTEEKIISSSKKPIIVSAKTKAVSKKPAIHKRITTKLTPPVTDSVNLTANKINTVKPEPLVYLDGKEITMAILSGINTNSIEAINVLKNESAITAYGERGRNGVVEITLKKQN